MKDFDYKAKCEELTQEYMKLSKENRQLKEDNAWIKKVLALALEKISTMVVREEELDSAPEIELAENLADELIISIKRRPSNEYCGF